MFCNNCQEQFPQGLVENKLFYTIKCKTFPENWDSKAPSIGTLLAYVETTA